MKHEFTGLCSSLCYVLRLYRFCLFSYAYILMSIILLVSISSVLMTQSLMSDEKSLFIHHKVEVLDWLFMFWQMWERIWLSFAEASLWYEKCLNCFQNCIKSGENYFSAVTTEPNPLRKTGVKINISDVISVKYGGPPSSLLLKCDQAGLKTQKAQRHRP